jgi:hypothetical protein
LASVEEIHIRTLDEKGGAGPVHRFLQKGRTYPYRDPNRGRYGQQQTMTHEGSPDVG